MKKIQKTKELPKNENEMVNFNKMGKDIFEICLAQKIEELQKNEEMLKICKDESYEKDKNMEQCKIAASEAEAHILMLMKDERKN